MSFVTDLRFAVRSLLRVKGLAMTVIVTLALRSEGRRGGEECRGAV
jgi:hypothetical protein